MSRAFVDRLNALCAAHPTRAKWAIVPSHGIGRTIGDRLVREGREWANVRFVTPFDLALRMGAPFLVERGIDPSGEGLGPALVMRLLLALPAAGGYFRPLAAQPDLAAALWATLREVRMAGLKAGGLRPDAFVTPAKHVEFAALVSAYEAFLAASSRGDRALVFEEALRHPDWCPVAAGDAVLVLPDARWQPLEQRLLDALPGERIAVAAAEPPAGRWLGAAAASFFTAGGADAEVEEVFRRLLASGTPLDEVEVVAPTPQLAALVWDKAIRFGWPVTIAHGLPAALTRPGRVLRAFVEWIDDDFAAGRLRRILQSGDVRLDDLDISPARAARILVKARAAWGRETFRLSLERHAASARRRAARDDVPVDQRDGLLRRADEAEALAAWIEARIAAVPAPDADGTVSIRDVAACAAAFVERCAARTSALDRLARAALAQAIAELAELGDFRAPLGDALRFLGERVNGLTIGADRARPGHLYVSTLAHAGYTGRASVFVMGLEEGRVFPLPLEDPILLDAERRAIGGGLRLSNERTDEAVALARARLADACGRPGVRMTFSYACRDLREYRQTYASWMMLDAFRQATGRADAEYQDLRRHLEDEVGVASCVPAAGAAALDDSRWWLRGIVAAGPASRPAVLRAFPALDAGIRAEAARDDTAFTTFDGHVPEAGARLDPCAPGRVVSPTQLEGAASCGFRYFLRYGLGVEAIETGERDRDVWLDPLLRGTLLHDLYADLLRRTREAGRRSSVADDHDWLRERGVDALERLAAEMPPPSGEVRARETDLLLRDLAIFVDAEARIDEARSAVGLEVGFGRGGSSEIEPLSREEPVLVDLGGGLTIRIAGRIDRIDRVDAVDRSDRADTGGAPDRVRFEIVDYKTGGFWREDWAGTFAGGTRLQHALYGLAATALLREETTGAIVTGAQYYFPSEKGGQERKHIEAPPLAHVRAVLADLRQVIIDGLFLHAADDRACRFCDYGAACGRNPVARAAAKLGDPALEGLRRLAAHE